MAYLAERGYVSRDRTDFVIITEPLNVDRVCLGHRGVYWFEVATLGRIAHGSMPFLGISAIGKMADFISAIERELQPVLSARTTAMPVEPPLARHPSININSISGRPTRRGISDSLRRGPVRSDFRSPIHNRGADGSGTRGNPQHFSRDIAARDADFRYEMKDLMTVHPRADRREIATGRPPWQARCAMFWARNRRSSPVPALTIRNT